MKTMKKVVALLLVAVMAIGLMATTAFAADDGTITVRNATVGEDYAVYKIFDLTYSDIKDKTDKVTGQNVAYTYTKTGADDALYAALTADGSPFTLTSSSVANMYSVTLKEVDGKTADAAAISKFLTGLTKLEVEGQDTSVNLLAGRKVGDTKTATSATVEFTGLPYGYYYVTSSLGTTVTLDSTLKDVTVMDKNQKPSWDNNPEDPDDPNPPEGQTNPGKVILVKDKDGKVNRVTENSVNYGDTVSFSIAVNATAYVDDKLATYYYITDTLADGFGNAKDIVVKVYPMGEDGKYKTSETEVKTLVEDVDYTLRTSEDGQSFQITIPFGEKFGAQAKIEVTYDAVVNADGTDVVIAGDGNLNTANFAYNTEPTDPNDPNDPKTPDKEDYPDDPYEPEDPEDPYDPDDSDSNPPYEQENEVTTTTYVYALAVQKVDPTGHKLSGAEFTIDGITAVQAKDESGNGIPGVYQYTGSGEATTLSTNADGMLIVKGLAAGTYSVAETKSPLGYNILEKPVSVSVTLTKKYTNTVISTHYYDAAGNEIESKEDAATTVTYQTTDLPVFGVEIVNQAGTELPSTGGMGTTILYIVGGMLVVAAGVLLITKKRMGREG